MSKDECLVFKVYDKRSDVPRFVFHTAFDDPTTPSDAPPRRSVEVRAIAVYPERRPPVFFDMVHSNNAARIRIWLKLKGLPEGRGVETRVVTYPDLQTAEYAEVNPLKKVPALIDEQGHPVYESSVILNYLEDLFEGEGRAPSFQPSTPEGRARVAFLCRMHDLYIASPNCTQPNFAHTQGAMYLSPRETAFCSAARAMDRPTRAAKLAEIWKQLCWIESACAGPWMTGAAVTHADMTWFPTAVFMEFMLPRVFGWPEVFRDPAVFPKLAAWHAHCMKHPAFAETRREIWDYWAAKEKEGQFESIKEELQDDTYKWKYP